MSNENGDKITSKRESNLLDYSLDENLNKEYEEFNKGLNINMKNVIVANSLLCLGIYSYFNKNIKKIFVKNRGISRNVFSALFYSIGSAMIVLIVNGYFLGITPSNIKRKKELEDRLMYQSNYQINFDLFKDIIDEDETKNEKKI